MPTLGQQSVCGEAGCGRPAKSHGLCNGHNKQRLDGRPLAPLRRVLPRMTTLRERLEASVQMEATTGCWLWERSILVSGGYGQMNWQGRPSRAHRLSYEEYVGPIPGGMMVCHRCDTPACINPEHLFLGTNADNVADRDKKGRVAKGEIHYAFGRPALNRKRLPGTPRPPKKRQQPGGGTCALTTWTPWTVFKQDYSR